jgi:phosphate transport system substrate-binding protein
MRNKKFLIINITQGDCMKKVLVSLFSIIALSANAFTITGAGASFPYPVYAKWAEQYRAETGNTVNYQSIGSSGGIKQINSKTVDFGASDVAVKQADLDKNGQVQFPMVMGGVVVVVNVPGVENNQLNLTMDQVADIFSGKITNWKELGQSLPDLDIMLAVRSDGSGTTGVFTQYLANHSASFKSAVGVGKTVTWKGNYVGGKGNAGVAALVGKIKGTIGYVEYAYAKQNNLPTAKIDGVEPSAEAFKSGKWILTAETYLIVYPDGENTKDVYKFVEWCYNNDQYAVELDYVPLSDGRKQIARNLMK